MKLALTLTPKGGGRPKGGTITFRSGDTVLGTATATKRITTITTTALPVGEPTVTATYSGDPKIAAATGKSVVVVVDPARTTTTLTSAGPVAPGERAELKATVRSGATRLKGSVAFGTEDTVLGVVALNTNGVAPWRPLLAEGSHEIIATYLGHGTDGQSTSSPVAQVVAPAVATIDQDHLDRSGSSAVIVGSDPIAQTFTAGRTGLLERIQLEAQYSGETIGVTITSTLGGLPYEELGSASVTGIGSTTDVILDQPVPVVAGTTYAIVVSTQHDVALYADADGYAGGQLLSSSAGNYFVESRYEASDLNFATWVR